jgi:spore germination protein YaaH
MSGRRPALVACCIGAALLLSPATAPARVCAKAAGLSFHRQAGKHSGRLSWKTPHRGRFRVYRNGEIVGQTVGRSLRVAVKPGNAYVFEVRAVRSNGHVSPCIALLKRQMRFYPPFTPRNLGVRSVRDTGATLEWTRARRGDGRINGYRVYRDGAVYRQVKKLTLRIRLTTPKVHTFAVAAADTQGHVSRLSRAVRVRNGHHGPGAPGALRVGAVTDSKVGLHWSASRRGSSRVVGYRVYRDGKPLTQVKGLASDISNLAPATPYTFSVAGVDTLGYVGRATRPASIRTAMPPPSTGHLHAFLLATTGESFRDLQRHYQQIGTLYPTYYDCYARDRPIKGVDDPLVTRWAQMRQIAVMPRFDCQWPDTIHKMLTDGPMKAATIAALVDLTRTYNYDGLNLDLESGYATDRVALTGFVAELASQLHALGKRVSVDVSAKYYATTTGRSGFYDYPGLSAVADTVFVMNWGWHWTTSAPGAIDDMHYFVPVADYVATMPNKSRFVLGMGLFGIDWPNGGGSSNRGTALEYADLIATLSRNGVTPEYDSSQGAWHGVYWDADGARHDVWYSDASTVSARINIVKSRGLGLGFWKLGTEDQGLWNEPLIAPGTAWP